jgi:hypothetical protein
VPYAYDRAIDDKEPPNGGICYTIRMARASRAQHSLGGAHNLAIHGKSGSIQRVGLPYCEWHLIYEYRPAPMLNKFTSRFQMPDLIDVAAPDPAKTRTRFDGQEYELVFPDKWDDPSQFVTKSGKLRVQEWDVAESEEILFHNSVHRRVDDGARAKSGDNGICECSYVRSALCWG